MATANATLSSVTVVWRKSDLALNPCILVTEKLCVERGVTYDKRDVEVQAHNDGSEDATWETQRHFKNKEETKKADQVYSNARYMIRSKCLYTEVGYVCPAKDRKQLLDAIDQARALVDDFNARAKFCSITFRVLLTNINPSNKDGVEALRETIKRNTEALKEAIKEFDVKRTRNMLVATRPVMDILMDGAAKTALEKVREEAREMASQIAEIVRAYDDNIENALVSQAGQELLRRVDAKWNF